VRSGELGDGISGTVLDEKNIVRKAFDDRFLRCTLANRGVQGEGFRLDKEFFGKPYRFNGMRPMANCPDQQFNQPTPLCRSG
jgi:hypothetical protein